MDDAVVADIRPGAVLGERYQIRGLIARGGMATVYLAVDQRLERTVALKVMHPAYASDPSFVDRFVREALSIARLSHPNVVAVYDQGSHHGLAYLVMEYVQGRTLREVLASRARLSPAEAAGVLDPLLAGLAAAHRIGMVPGT
ncbi:protein kinase domain-containing protein [Fodinicola feengrottensis]|uniref:protein kinase domain-containing protein n=1 Tax=Fodinicola feengrottensis TaxID=435914 RepID=UPI0013D5663E|nr:protein kinase [Fodinicola feengrottensis]